jgi:hypothetical protein
MTSRYAFGAGTGNDQVFPPQPQYTKNITEATTNPAVTNDSSQNYKTGSVWINGSKNGYYVCVDPSPGAAVWIRMPTLVYTFEGFCQTDNETNGSYFVNLDPTTFGSSNGALASATGFRSRYSVTMNSAFSWLGWTKGSTSQQAACEYDPHGVRVSPGSLNLNSVMGEGYYRIKFTWKHPPNDTNARYVTGSGGTGVQGDVTAYAGISFSSSFESSVSFNQFTEFGLRDNGSQTNSVADFERVIYINQDGLRFIVNTGFPDIEQWGVFISVEKLT